MQLKAYEWILDGCLFGRFLRRLLKLQFRAWNALLSASWDCFHLDKSFHILWIKLPFSFSLLLRILPFLSLCFWSLPRLCHGHVRSETWDLQWWAPWPSPSSQCHPEAQKANLLSKQILKILPSYRVWILWLGILFLLRSHSKTNNYEKI